VQSVSGEREPNPDPRPGLTSGQGPVPGSGATDSGKEGPVTGRTSGLGIAVILFALLALSWIVQFSSALQHDFGPFEDRLSDGGMLGGFVLGAAIAIVPPIVVLVLQARTHKRNPHHSIAAVVAAVAVLVIAVPINTVVVGLESASIVKELREEE
jgi:hypothetical protein